MMPSSAPEGMGRENKGERDEATVESLSLAGD